jgi:hypothetical protein
MADKEEVKGEERFYSFRTRYQEVKLLLNNFGKSTRPSVLVVLSCVIEPIHVATQNK